MTVIFCLYCIKYDLLRRKAIKTQLKYICMCQGGCQLAASLYMMMMLMWPVKDVECCEETLTTTC